MILDNPKNWVEQAKLESEFIGKLKRESELSLDTAVAALQRKDLGSLLETLKEPVDRALKQAAELAEGDIATFTDLFHQQLTKGVENALNVAMREGTLLPHEVSTLLNKFIEQMTLLKTVRAE